MLILLALACSGEPAALAPAEPPPAELPTAEKPEAPRDPAPSLDVYGLALGSASDADMQAWLTGRKLTCPGSPSARRTTHRYACQGDLPQEALPERPTQGQLTQILLVRGDETPLTHVSSIRTHSVPDGAASDFEATTAAIVGKYGAPHAGTATVERAKVDARLVHYDATWRYSDLDIHVSLNRLGGRDWMVTENWDVPGAEEKQEARAGGSPHGHGASDSKLPPHHLAPPKPQ